MNSPSVIDLFCGAGGLSLGFLQAGFHLVGAFDNLQINIDTYNKNIGQHAYLANLHTPDILTCLKKHVDVPKDIDVLIGGPPCQGFSLGGSRNISDKRNLLLFDFANAVIALRPRYFVMENVRGLMMGHAVKTLNRFLRKISKANYQYVSPVRILDAADYGVPQTRLRTIVLGWRDDVSPVNYPKCCSNEFSPTVADAIKDLPRIEEYDYLFESDVFRGKLSSPSQYVKDLHGIFFSDPVSTKNNLSGCRRTRHSSKTVKRFAKTQPGKSEPISRYKRLEWQGKCTTIRAGTGSDHGNHTAPRPIHPEEARCITVREAARLHSFPDWFEFQPAIWNAFRQIGNSVPPLLAFAVAKELSRKL